MPLSRHAAGVAGTKTDPAGGDAKGYRHDREVSLNPHAWAVGQAQEPVGVVFLAILLSFHRAVSTWWLPPLATSRRRGMEQGTPQLRTPPNAPLEQCQQEAPSKRVRGHGRLCVLRDLASIRTLAVNHLDATLWRDDGSVGEEEEDLDGEDDADERRQQQQQQQQHRQDEEEEDEEEEE